MTSHARTIRVGQTLTRCPGAGQETVLWCGAGMGKSTRAAAALARWPRAGAAARFVVEDPPGSFDAVDVWAGVRGW